MNKELIKYINKPTWCPGYTGWSKNCVEFEEHPIKDADKQGKLYTNIHRTAFIDSKEFDAYLDRILKSCFDTKLIATYCSNKDKEIRIIGLGINLENRVMGNYVLTNESVLNGSAWRDEIIKVRLCENENEAIQKIIKGEYELLDNMYTNLKIRTISNISEIKKDIYLDTIALSSSNNVLKENMIGEMSKEEQKFIFNIIIHQRDLEGTNEYIKEYEETNKITLKEVGEKYSMKLANIMFEIGYFGWFFEDTNSLEKMKEQMTQTLKDDPDLEQILSEKGMTKEEVFAEIENVKLNLMPTKVDEFIEKLNNEYETEETQENN